jgi:MoxR-like ATPase
MNVYLDVEPGAMVSLPARGTFPAQVHVFEPDAINAVNAALAARRPLLVRGEPGTGKSQLASASAMAMGCVFVSKIIDSATEPRDLLWSFDGVARLAEAQVQGVLGSQSEDQVRERLDQRRFLAPGPLWWAFDWSSALSQAELAGQTPPAQWQSAEPDRGAVVLIDEIDKADAAVPNGLLECLGSGQLQPPGMAEPVVMRGKRPPLVVITTNEERALPDAFLRRCLVLHLELPREQEKLVEKLVSRGRAHFPECADSVLQKAAVMLSEDRSKVAEQGLCPPGQAEYLDLIRALTGLSNDEQGQLDLLVKIGRFTLKKHPPEPAL